MNECERIVDAALQDFFGTIHNEPIIDMIAEQVIDEAYAHRPRRF